MRRTSGATSPTSRIPPRRDQGVGIGPVEGSRVGGAAGGATATETAQSLDFSLSEVGLAHDPSTLARRALAVDSRLRASPLSTVQRYAYPRALHAAPPRAMGFIRGRDDSSAPRSMLSRGTSRDSER